MIQAVADDFLSKCSDSASLRKAIESDGGTDPELWNTIRHELGWCSLTIPEHYNGMGIGQLERTLLMEQLGRRLCTAPYLASAAFSLPAAAGWIAQDCTLSKHKQLTVRMAHTQ